VPKQPGVHVLKAYDIAQLVEVIDWTPFFASWELHGKFPKILDDEVVGVEAKKLYNDAQAMLKKMIAENWVEGARGVRPVPGQPRVNDDDIEVYADESREKVLMTWHNLRQQMKKPVKAAPTCASPTLSRPKASGLKDLPRRLRRHRRIAREDERAAPSKLPTTITPPSCSSRCATAWPRPLPSTCIGGCAASSGAMPARKRSPMTS